LFVSRNPQLHQGTLEDCPFEQDMLVGSERTYLVDGCEAGIRADGRGCLDWRPVSVETNIIVSASGSARVRLGATDVIVGVKVNLPAALRQGCMLCCHAAIALRCQLHPSFCQYHVNRRKPAAGGHRDA